MACNYTRQVLVFGSTQIGSRVHSFRSTFRRATPVKVRHSYWSTQPILDGGYPAIVWDHTFTVYTEAGSVLGLAEEFFDLVSKVSGETQSLQLKPTLVTSTTSSGLVAAVTVTTPVKDFGNCYLQDSPELSQPEQFLMSCAGMFTLQFLGTTKPV